MSNVSDSTKARLEPALGAGYGLRRGDDTFSLASHALQVLAAPWGAPDEWWELVRERITLPPATLCSACGLGQLLGSVEVTLPLPEGDRSFEITFSGHAHGLAEAEAGDMLLVRDVTAQRRRVSELYDTLQQYESLCESIEEVYYRTDLDGTIAFISPSAYKLLAFHPEDLLGRSIVDLCIDPEYWQELLEILEKNNQVSEFDLVLQCKKGNQVPVSMSAQVLLDKNGRRVAIDGILRDVTEREHLDTLLAERTRKLQETMAELEHQKFALDQHAIVSVTDSEGRIVSANKRMLEITQYGVNELRGQNPRLLNSGYHSRAFFEEMWRTIANGRVWHGELRNRRKDGSHYWVDCTIVPFMTPSGKPYQYVAISTDISERINAERRMESNRAFLLAIANAMGEGLYVVDLQGRLIFLNREGERLLGWREEELMGKVLHNVIHHLRPNGALYPIEECSVHRSMVGRGFRVDEDHFIHKDGRFLQVSFVTAPLHQDGVVSGVVTVFQDITQRKLLQDELRTARDAALEGSRLKSEFLASMSHEIRTPMNAVVGMTDLLLDTPLNEEQYEFVEIVRESSQSLLGIINDILDFSKIEAGKIDLEQIEFTPVMVVEGAAELLAAQAHEKGISLMTYVDPAIPRILRGDPGRLRQMLVNLLGNAIKFTEEGEVTVQVTLEGRREGPGRLHFQVHDTGIGLSRKALERIFQPFIQADGATTRKFGGTGLGLAISKRLAELMGGEIGADSQEGEGSTFWFRLPCVRADEENAPDLAERLPLGALRKLRVLAAVERATDRAILGRYLEGWRVDHLLVESGAEVMLTVEREAKTSRPVDVVLASMALGDVDPLTLPKWLASHPHTRLVGLAEADDKELDESARTAGFAQLLAKPLRQSELVEALVTAVHPQAARPREEGLLLPTAAPATREAAPVKPAPDAYEALESGNLILLAEDNPVNQKVALMQLKKLGYASHAVANGKEAVEALSHLPYALVLMDCQMPIMDGFEATHAVRKMESATARHTPIIALTANAMKGDRDRCLKAGMDDYLSKPVTPEELKKKLEFWIPRCTGELPPIEINQLRQLFGNDEEVIRELLHHFLPSAQDLLQRLRTAIQNGQADSAGELAHELKGACANMGAAAMAQAARRLEKLAQGDWEEATAQMAALERAFVRVESFVAQY